jgi:hypothetical protein
VQHIFTAVVGAGVLALPQAVAWMGWVGGPLALIVFYVVSLMFSRLLSDVYEVCLHFDPDDMQAVFGFCFVWRICNFVFFLLILPLGHCF